MAKNKISEWSATAANNTDVGGIDIAEGCAPSGINNAIREMMAQVKDMVTGADGDSQTIGGNLSVTGTSTLTGAVTAPAGITANLTGTVTGNITGNAQTVTNGVYTTGNQTIAGTKTFSSTISGSIDGNAATVTNGVYTTSDQTIGGVKTFSSNIVGNLTGNASTANTATTATLATSATTATTATKATNIAGGGSGQVPYNSAADTTAFLAAGTSGQYLKSNGTSAPSWATLNSLTSDTAKASTSGTTVDFTGIPSWAKRITVIFDSVSTNGSSNVLVQLGDSGGIETTGYLGASSGGPGSSNYTTGFGINENTSSSAFSGNLTISLINSSTNTWIASGVFARNSVATMILTSGTKSTSATLDRVRITTVNGTDAFDAGSINIMYE